MLFEIFLGYNISIKPIKLFLNYPDIELLGQRLNSLRLIIFDKKLKAIYLPTYPNTLGALEYYLSLTGYLQSYIYFYTQLVTPLNNLKILLFCHISIAGQQHRVYTLKIMLRPLTPQELASFLLIQDAWNQLLTLIYHDPKKVLWIDLDTSKEFGFRVIVFHTVSNKALLEGR